MTQHHVTFMISRLVHRLFLPSSCPAVFGDVQWLRKKQQHALLSMLTTLRESVSHRLPDQSFLRDRTAEIVASRGCSHVRCRPLTRLCADFIGSNRQTPIDRSFQHGALHGRHQVFRQSVTAATHADDELLLSSEPTSPPAVKAIRTALPYGPRVWPPDATFSKPDATGLTVLLLWFFGIVSTQVKAVMSLTE